jgi:hypothetical protein
MSTKGKKYSEWTAEEKAAYKAKREAYWTKRAEDTAVAFTNLEAELKALKVDQKILDLLQAAKRGAGVEKGARQASNREGYLTQMFGTETPAEGALVSYLFIGVRGPQGERMNEGETMGQFVTRVGDCDYKYDANTIASLVWYLKKRGHKLENDRASATVKYLGFEAPAADAVVPASPAEAPKAKAKK